MLKISEFELLKLVILTDSNVKLEETIVGMVNSIDKLNNQMGKILTYLGYETLTDVRIKYNSYHE